MSASFDTLEFSNGMRVALAGGRYLVLCLLSVFILAGCDRGEPASASRESSAGTNPAAKLSEVAFAIPTNLSVPFQGVIKAKEQRDLMLNSAEITYTFDQGKIRREAKRTASLGKLADLGVGAAGIICDVQADRVVLYRSGQPGKFFARMTVAEYRKHTTAANAGMSDASLAVLAVKPAVWKHVGTFFMEVPRPIPTGHAVNLAEARTADGLPCDLLTIQLNQTVFEVYHSQRIKVDRELLELVELGLPAEVTGFPVLMRRLQLVAVQPPDKSRSKGRQLLQKGANWAAKMAEKALKREVELLQITESVPPDTAFTLDDGFVEVSTLEELHLRFAPATGNHDDWD